MHNLKAIGLFIAVICFSVTIGVAGSAAKSYQVTGVVTEITDAKIVVEKADGEKWEIDRTADTKSEGEHKVGDKVTVAYTMKAKTITSKPAAAADKTTSAKPKK